MAISHGACWLPSTLTIYLLDRVLEKGLLERFFPLHEIVCKTEDLKTVVIADDPKVQLAPVLLVGRNLDKTRVPREPIHGSIPVRCSDTLSGKESRPQSRWLVVRDLFRAVYIANVENSHACILKRASEHCRIVGTVCNASFL